MVLLVYYFFSGRICGSPPCGFVRAKNIYCVKQFRACEFQSFFFRAALSDSDSDLYLYLLSISLESGVWRGSRGW